MVIYQKNRAIFISYSARGFKSGLSDVSVIVYDQAGGTSLASSTMSELGTSGIYLKRFTPPRDGSYFAVCNSTSYPKKSFAKFVVGEIKAKGGGGIIRDERIWSKKEKEFIIAAVKKLTSIKIPIPEKIDLSPLQNKLKKIEELASKLYRGINLKDKNSDTFEALQESFNEISSTFSKTRMEQQLLFEKIEEIKLTIKLITEDDSQNQVISELQNINKELDEIRSNSARLKLLEDGITSS